MINSESNLTFSFAPRRVFSRSASQLSSVTFDRDRDFGGVDDDDDVDNDDDYRECDGRSDKGCTETLCWWFCCQPGIIEINNVIIFIIFIIDFIVIIAINNVINNSMEPARRIGVFCHQDHVSFIQIKTLSMLNLSSFSVKMRWESERKSCQRRIFAEFVFLY